MTELQFMPFYWGDFLGDTMHLTGLESGVYALLLGNMWLRHGWIPDNDAEIARICRVDEQTWAVMKPKIEPFLKRRKGRISQKRLLDELRKAENIRQKNRDKTAKMRTAKAEKHQQTSSVKASYKEGNARARLDNHSSGAPPTQQAGRAAKAPSLPLLSESPDQKNGKLSDPQALGALGLLDSRAPSPALEARKERSH